MMLGWSYMDYYSNAYAMNQYLAAHGFTVLTHSRVPCNDGGISLGQAVVAAARDRLPPHPFGSDSHS